MQTRPPTKVQERIKGRVISALVEVRTAILEAASSVPEDRSKEVFLGTWSLLDLLAHLSGWDDTNREALAEVMSGNLPAFYAHYDSDWRAYNARLVEKYRRDRLDEQIAFVRATHLRLVESLRALPADAFNRDFDVRIRGYRVSIRRLLEAEARDEAIHLDQLHRFIHTFAAVV